jgi:UDP-hydrolysing UDP-N-acetyl-D-glucosamine 2-epimerase
MKKTITVVLVDRANYGRIFPLLKELNLSTNFNLNIICSGSMLLEKYGYAYKQLINDKLKIKSKIYIEIDGSRPETMAKSIGLGIIQFSQEFSKLKSDIILLIGDRYECLAAAISASYMNFCVAHIQGGEISGSIDESARHAITKFSHIHFPSTQKALENIVSMGENPKYVHNVGCPSGDYIKKITKSVISNKEINNTGIGANINLNSPFILVSYHPTTTNLIKEKKYSNDLIKALSHLKMQTIWIWPNIDAGSDIISKNIRVFREHHKPKWLHLVKNIDPIIYQKLLKKTICAVGNSSSFVRDSSFSGTPVVLVGDRQNGRERATNVIASKNNYEDILKNIKKQLKSKYKKSSIYGNGNSVKKILKVLVNKKTKFYQKKFYKI